METLRQSPLESSIQVGNRAYLPKEKLGEIVSSPEDTLTHEYLPGWKGLLMTLEMFFAARWEEDCKKWDEDFWKEFDAKSKYLVGW